MGRGLDWNDCSSFVDISLSYGHSFIKSRPSKALARTCFAAVFPGDIRSLRRSLPVILVNWSGVQRRGENRCRQEILRAIRWGMCGMVLRYACADHVHVGCFRHRGQFLMLCMMNIMTRLHTFASVRIHQRVLQSPCGP